MTSIPLPIIADAARIANLYHSGDATFVNTYWVHSTAGGATAAQFAADFIDAYDNTSSAPTMRSLHSSDITLDGVEVTLLDGVTPTLHFARGAGIHGAGVSPMAAAQASLIITWETGIRGRNNRGRTFLAGVPNASLEAGGARWGTAIIADADLWVTNFMNALLDEPTGLELLVVSQRSETGPSHHPVLTFVSRQGVGTQRRRTERNNP